MYTGRTDGPSLWQGGAKASGKSCILTRRFAHSDYEYARAPPFNRLTKFKWSERRLEPGEARDEASCVGGTKP